MQIMDLLVLDLNTFRYEKRKLIASVLFIQLGINFNAFRREEICSVPDIPMLLMQVEQEMEDFSTMIQHFLLAFFSLSMAELVDSIQFTSKFFALEASSDMPIIIKNKKENASVSINIHPTYSC